MKRSLNILLIGSALLAAGVAGAFLLAAIAYVYVADSLPDVQTLKDVRLEAPMRIYSRDGRLLAEFGEKRRLPVTYEQIPESVVQAIIAAEDDRFFQHPGVDYQGLLRAAYIVLATGERRQGGSTITMQVARNYLLTREKTYLRKLREIFVALHMERVLTKEEILTLYLNKIFLGHRAYGVAAAAEVYYGKTLAALGLDEVATLAGLPKAPSSDNPVTSPERARDRRNYVLRRMYELGFIALEAYETAHEAPIVASLHGPTVEQEAWYFAENVRAEMYALYGDAAYTEGYRVTTTLDSRLQGAAVRAVRRALLEYDRRHGYRGPLDRRDDWRDDQGEAQPEAVLSEYPQLAELHLALVTEVGEEGALAHVRRGGPVSLDLSAMIWARRYITQENQSHPPKQVSDVLSVGDVVYLRQVETGEWHLAQAPEVQGALVSLDPIDGAVVALVGGYDFYASKFNRAVQARRQPGSSFKPLVYSAALDNGFTTATLVPDAPVVFDDPSLERAWRPENYEGRFSGLMRLREALVKSRNLVSIRVLRSIGIRSALAYIERFGFTEEELPRDLSLALGSASLSPLQMSAAYSVLASGGFRTEPYFIQRITSAGGDLVFDADPLIVCRECAEALEADSLRVADDYDEDGAEVVEQTDPFGCELQPGALASFPREQLAPQVLTPQNAYLIGDMMRDVIRRGTGVRAMRLGRGDLSGKTGTTNDQRDAWFNGFNATLVATAWVGFDDVRPLGRGFNEQGASVTEVGGVAALPAWMYYMGEALAGVPNQIPEQPWGLVRVKISPDTGLLARANDPESVYEIFRVGQVPPPGEEQDPLSLDEDPADDEEGSLF